MRSIMYDGTMLCTIYIAYDGILEPPDGFVANLSTSSGLAKIFYVFQKETFYEHIDLGRSNSLSGCGVVCIRGAPAV